MRRQLYAGGGIASLVPRQEYGLGSIVKSVGKAVKGAVKSVGDFAKSDIGKAALLAAGGYYLGGGAAFGGPGFSFGKLGSSIASPFSSLKTGLLGTVEAGTGQYGGGLLSGIMNTKLGSSLLSSSALKTGAAILGGSALMTSLFGSPQQAQQLYQQNPGAVKNYLGQYYRNVNPKKEGQSDEEYEQEVSSFIGKNIAEYDVSQSSTFADGGRVGLAEGGISTFQTYQNYLNEIQDAQANQQYNPLYNPTVSFQTSDGRLSEDEDQVSVETGNLNRGAGLRETMSNIASNVRSGNFNIGNAFRGAMFGGIPGGVMGGFGSTKGNTFGVDDVNSMSVGGFSDGTSSAADGGEAGAAAASAAGSNDGPGGGTFADGGRVMKELGGIMDIPMGEPRMNQGGVPELDYRQEGGFVPVGIKEKADDVPAMLSKNEFVMTADAVKGMGNGSVENGAQKMYNLMKSLENRIA